MKKQIEQVELFRKTFKLGICKYPTLNTQSSPRLLYDLMKEENEEYLQAIRDRDIVGVADALGDMLYVLLGSIAEHGMQDKIEEIFDEIQASNMSKLGEGGLPIFREDGKVLKGYNYFKPNISKIILQED